MTSLDEKLRSNPFFDQIITTDLGELKKRQKGTLDTFEVTCKSFNSHLSPVISEAQKEAKLLMASQEARIKALKAQ
eukprot:11419797-Alexandrium_andersonii.AAC.1